MTIRLGIDIGGTFTDEFIYNEITSEVSVSKVPSTPPTFIDGVMNVIKKSKIDLSQVSRVVHGSTIVDNAIIQRAFPKTCFITTKGFRDILFIGRYWRGELFDVQWDRPTQFNPILRRRDIFTIEERIGGHGEIVTPLKEEDVYDVARRIREQGYESVAIFLINSYVNPVHEEKVKSIILKECPNVYVTISTEICPIIRELPRLCTSILNACIVPIVDRYIKSLMRSLKNEHFAGKLLIMQSNGGVMRWDVATSRPIYVATSGPAAGVTAACYVARMLGMKNVITFDMGGTTAKSATVIEEESVITTEFNLEWDVPIAVPMIDMAEIGAGGGSIAWIDRGGMLRVGPISAGAVPGPVCYSAGGTEPTVTDANLILGILNPNNFLGGEKKLDVNAARHAVKTKIADPLGISVEEAAMGIIKIAGTNMVQNCRTVTIEKGYDPRDFVLIAFGGAGPMHAYALMEELEIPKVIIPLNAAVFSAYGLCVADFFHDFVKTHFVRAEVVDVNELTEIYAELEAKALSELRKEGIPENRIELHRYVKMKYVGETLGGGLEVPVPSGRLTRQDVQKLVRSFHEIHKVRYAFSREEEFVHFVDLRVRGIGKTSKPMLQKWKKGGLNASKAIKGRREVYLDGWMTIPIYEREKLEPRNIIDGPAIIEESMTTIVVLEGYRLEVDEFKNLIITK